MLQFTVTETNTEGNPPIGTTSKRWDFLSPPVMSTDAAHCCTRTFPWTSIGSDIFGAFSEKLTKSPACCISAVLSENAPGGPIGWKSMGKCSYTACKLQQVSEILHQMVHRDRLPWIVTQQRRSQGGGGKGGSRDSGGRWKECSSYRELQSLLVSVITNQKLQPMEELQGCPLSSG